jgi:FMN phosphatase YigB (HAD superfamily)
MCIQERTKQWLAQSLGVPHESLDALYKSIQSAHPHPYFGFASLGLSPEDYLRNVFDGVDIREYLSVDTELERLLVALRTKNIITTLSSPQHSLRVQTSLGVTDVIHMTLNAINFPPTYSKIEMYRQIQKQERATSGDCIVIGDNQELDIKPAVDLGMTGHLITNDRPIKLILEELLRSR